jgi:hypothetical protein
MCKSNAPPPVLVLDRFAGLVGALHQKRERKHEKTAKQENHRASNTVIVEVIRKLSHKSSPHSGFCACCYRHTLRRLVHLGVRLKNK